MLVLEIRINCNTTEIVMNNKKTISEEIGRSFRDAVRTQDKD
jgi:hypothetical protein